MDLYFLPAGGAAFSIEVGYFDTMLEIKQKVEKYNGIPVSKQTLIFNGCVLPDDLNIHDSDIIDRSRIHILVAAAAADDRNVVYVHDHNKDGDRKSNT